MIDHDSLHERGRALEEEFFRKKNQELVEKMKQRERDAEVLRDIAARAGVDDPEVVRELQKLGFTPETVGLLPLVPLVQVAWADGSIAEAEREKIVDLARSRGVVDGSAAYVQLQAWLADRPSWEVFDGARRLIRAVVDAPGGETKMTVDELVAYCEEIASASGGLFGLRKISAEERDILTSIATQLKKT
jgi:hypothetical protein